ncbi:hypothetical protein [Streptomyces sp. NPDC048606]|uniref:sensor histidine kinase n=1 Tax=Streptomyces sp. NPDC048606 TaxID=3154726 RepID=UPI0034292BAD
MAWYAPWRRRPAPAADPVGDRLTALAARLGPAREQAAADPGPSAELPGLERDLRVILHEARFEAPGYRQVRLGAALDRTVATLRAVGIEVDSRTAPEQAGGRAVLDALEPRVSDALGWVLRECTANILRHSTADRVWITVGVTAGRVRLAIANNGAPRPRPGARLGHGAGSGLPSMLTQASVLGGTLRIEYSGTDFEVIAEAPTGPGSTIRGPTAFAPASGTPRREEDTR